MNLLFDINPWLIGLFALAVLIALIGIARHARRWRAALLILQLPLAALLLGTLLLRDGEVEGGMIVLAANAEMPSAVLLESNLPIVALPSAPEELLMTPELEQQVERFADLATVLRRYPQISHLHLIGDRLGPADRDALKAIDLSMQASIPSETDAAIVELELPSEITAGTHWRLSGRVRVDIDRLQLLDPAQQEVDSVEPDADGRFALGDLARAAGPSLYTLQLRGADVLQQSLRVPINATTAAPLRALLLAAVPTAETKYLRRWATDASVQLESRISLAPTLTHGNAKRISAASFAELDLLIVDERSWSTLRPLRDELQSAVEDGMGLLLRVTGPVPDAVLADWQALGLSLQIADLPSWILHLSDAAGDVEGEPLHAWPMDVDSAHTVPVWRDASGKTLAARQLLRQGRIGAVWLSDSFVLYTRGERERHAELWAELFGALARARAEPLAQLPARAHVGRRAVFCSRSDSMRIRTPDGEVIALTPRDGENSAEYCAAFWPRDPGWHRLLTATRNSESEADQNSPFYVFPAEAAASLLEAADRFATAALVNRADAPSEKSSDREPWRRYALLAWLLLTTMTWWIERRAQSGALNDDDTNR